MAEVSELLVLHTVRLIGVAGVDAIAGRLSTDRAEVEPMLRGGETSGFLRHRQGTLQGWALTPEGRRHVEDLLAAELDRRGARASVESAYGEFLQLNPLILEVCSDWQVIRVDAEMVLNDHADEHYDRVVLERLDAIHRSSLPMLARLSQVLRRFSGYRPRLDTAVRRARGGQREWVTKPLIDSYHTVWFELHEDLLATLGRRRSEERDNG